MKTNNYLAENVVLNANEKRLLNNPIFKQGTRLAEYKKDFKDEENLRVRRFFKEVNSGLIFLDGLEFFHSKTGKEVLISEGVRWSADEFKEKTYLIKKSFFHKKCRLAKAVSEHPELIDKFVAESYSLSVDSCLSYINAILNPKPEKVETVDMDVETVDMDVETVDILPVNTAGKFSLKDVEKLFAHASKADIEASIELLFTMIK